VPSQDRALERAGAWGPSFASRAAPRDVPPFPRFLIPFPSSPSSRPQSKRGLMILINRADGIQDDSWQTPVIWRVAPRLRFPLAFVPPSAAGLMVASNLSFVFFLQDRSPWWLFYLRRPGHVQNVCYLRRPGSPPVSIVLEILPHSFFSPLPFS